MVFFSEKISGLIVAGGYRSSAVYLLIGDLKITQLPDLPQNINGSSMVAHNGTILLCGGWDNNKQKCLQLDCGTWKEHSTLNKARVAHSIVTTQTATFVFGGSYSKTTYEYLPSDSTKWLTGKTKIPGGFGFGCAIAVKSKQEIWLIGGTETQKRILSFDVNDHTFQEMPFHLHMGRILHKCTFIPMTNKIMITGGHYYTDHYYTGHSLNCVEILDTEDESVTLASPMKSKRLSHGMGIITVNGEDKVAAFGGLGERNYLVSVELYNTHTGKWEMTDLKLSELKCSFGFLAIKLGDIVSKL